MSNAHGMPPYSEVVFFDDTFQRLKTQHLGLLCWLIAHARPAGEGAWVVDEKQPVIAKGIRVGVNTVGPMLDYLHAAGYITTVKGKGRGRGKGGGNDMHYLTYHPALGRPDDSSPQPPNGSPKNREPKTWDESRPNDPKNRDTKKRTLYAVSLREPGPDSPESGKPNPQQVSCLSVEEQIDKTTAPEIPNAVRTGLSNLNWNFEAFAIPADTDWSLLMAHIAYANDHHLGPGWLNNRIKEGLPESAKRHNLIGRDPHHRAGEPHPAPGRMTQLEYDQYAEQYPLWAARVETIARDRNDPSKPYIPPTLLWQVAAEIGAPDATAQSAT